MMLREPINWIGLPGGSPLGRNRLERSLVSLQDEMNRLLGGFSGDYGAQAEFSAVPPVDIIEYDDGYEVTAEIPRLSADDVEISLAEGALTLTGEGGEEETAEDENYLRRECSYGSFERTIGLPQDADCDNAEAVFEDGILTILLPKKEGASRQVRKLQIRRVA